MPQPAEKLLEDHVEQVLKQASIPYIKNAVIEGARPDFVVTAPDGRVFTLEAKAWPPTRQNIKRAVHQIQLYKKAISVDKTYIVFPQLPASEIGRGVVDVGQLPRVLALDLGRTEAKRVRRLSVLPTAKRTILAAMPFPPKFDDAYILAMIPAAKSVNAVCERMDHKEYVGEIPAKIRASIAASVAVIGDLSESNPNVLYEVGVSHALNKPTVHICSTPLKELPFNVSHWNTIEYHQGQVHLLQTALKKRLRALDKAGELKG